MCVCVRACVRACGRAVRACVRVCVPLSLDFLLFVITVVVYGRYPVPMPEKPGKTTKRSDISAHLNADSFRSGNDCVASSTAPPPPLSLSLSLSSLSLSLSLSASRLSTYRGARETYKHNNNNRGKQLVVFGHHGLLHYALAKICGTFPFDNR